MKRRLAIKQRLIQKRKEVAQHYSESPHTEELSPKHSAKSDVIASKQGVDHAGN